MQAVTDLVKLRDCIESRARRLESIAAQLDPAINASDKRSVAHIVIELDNLIVVGLRQYVKSCLLRSRTAAGVRVTANVRPRSTEEAAAYVMKAVNPKTYEKKFRNAASISEKDEIAIRDPRQIAQTLLAYNASNIAQFNLALSLNATVFSEIKHCRHFFAHRARNTYEMAQDLAAKIGIRHTQNVEAFLLQGRPSTGVRILDGWLGEVRTFFDLAT